MPKQTLLVNSRAQLAVDYGDDDTLLLNLDPSVTISLGDDRGVTSSLSGLVVPLEPLASAVVNGRDGPTFVVTPPGQTAMIAIARGISMLGVSPAAIAAQILASGISLLANPVKLYDTGATLAGSGGGAIQQLTPITQVTVNSLPGSQCNYISYDLELKATIASTVEAVPLIFVAIDFYEFPTDTVPVDSINWVVAAGNTGHITQGKGPLRGQYMVVKASNLSTSNNPVVIDSFKLYGNSRSIQRDDWRDIFSGNLTSGVGGLKAMTSNMQTNLVGLNSLLVVNGGANNVRLAGLWAGEVSVYLNVTGLTTDQMQFQLIAASTGEMIENIFVGSAGNQVIHRQYNFPREPVLVTYTNGTAATPGTITSSIVALEP